MNCYNTTSAKLEIALKELKELKLRNAEFSESIYNIIYKDNKPEHRLSSHDFMSLIFISDELSGNPIFSKRLSTEVVLEFIESGDLKKSEAVSFYCRANGYNAENVVEIEKAVFGDES